MSLNKILSIQSHVASGYVGNRAAVFPLQRMGFDVIAVNTVQFSNHTGYGAWKGDIFSKEHIENVLTGLEEHGALKNVSAVLTGYLGDAGLGALVLDTVTKIKTHNKNLRYICDPVMGDVGRGVFVKDDLPPFFKTLAVPAADVITPNQFELTLLTGQEVTSLDSVINACEMIHNDGPSIILVTSLITKETKDDEIQMLVSEKGAGCDIVTTPKIELDPAPNGSGDLTAALFAGHLIAGKDSKQALHATSASVYKTFEQTEKAGSRELALIQSQDYFR